MPFLIKIEGDASGGVSAAREVGEGLTKMGEHGHAAHNIIAEAAEKAGIKHRELHRLVDMLGEGFGVSGRMATLGLFGPVGLGIGGAIAGFSMWREHIEKVKEAMEQAAQAFAVGFEGMLSKAAAMNEALQKIQDKFDETQRKIHEADQGDEAKRLDVTIKNLQATEEARERFAKAHGASPDEIARMREHEKGLEATETHVAAGRAIDEQNRADNAAAAAARRAEAAQAGLNALGNPEDRRKAFAKRIAEAQKASVSGLSAVDLAAYNLAHPTPEGSFTSQAEIQAAALADKQLRAKQEMLEAERDAKAFEEQFASNTHSKSAADTGLSEALARQTAAHDQARSLGVRSDELGFAARQNAGVDYLNRSGIGAMAVGAAGGDKGAVAEMLRYLTAQQHYSSQASAEIIRHLQTNANNWQKVSATVKALDDRIKSLHIP